MGYECYFENECVSKWKQPQSLKFSAKAVKLKLVYLQFKTNSHACMHGCAVIPTCKIFCDLAWFNISIFINNSSKSTKENHTAEGSSDVF